MRNMTKSRIANAFVVVVLAAFCATLVPAHSASALSTTRFDIEKVAELPRGGADGRTNAVHDPATGHLFIADRTSHEVLEYDLSADRFDFVATIPLGADYPIGLAIDPPTHRLFVGIGSGAIISYDIDPTSPMKNSPITTVLTGGVVPQVMVYDDERIFAVRQASSTLSIVDLRSGTNKLVSGSFTGDALPGLQVDPTSHIAYVASGSSILVIAPDGSTTEKTGVEPIRTLALSGRQLYVATTRLSVYNVSDWSLRAGPVLRGGTRALTSDDDLGVMYVAHTAGGGVIDGLTTISSSDLSVDGELPIGPAYGFTLGAHHQLLVNYLNSASLYTVTAKPVPEVPAVKRLAGADRYAVSAGVSAWAFGAGVPVAYVASGSAFPDALSASAAAGVEKGPVLLTTRDAIPQAVRDELTRLHPGRIVVMGGTAGVSAEVERELQAYSSKVTRVGGANRYEVSAALSRERFGADQPVVYLSSGETFPDALSGAPAAGRDGVPVLLVQKDSVPDVIRTELARLNPAKVVVLGGVNAISEAVVTSLGKPTTRIAGADRYVVSGGVAATFATPSKTVYVASGAGFPDALSGGAAAILKGAPVVLVTPDSIPPSADEQLKRLDPFKIVVLGGTAAISDSVVNQLKAYLTP